MSEHKRIPPALTEGIPTHTTHDQGAAPILGTVPVGEVVRPAEAEVFFRDCYAVLVRGKTVRRHLYFNLPAAERAVKRAHARGASAELVLVRLVPVDARFLDHSEGVGA